MVLIEPNIIHFTHSKINERFTGCGKLLSETRDEIVKGTTKIESIPKIKVFYVEKDGSMEYFSENNRRLWVFKSLQKLGIINVIDVRLEKTNDKKDINNTYALESKIIKKTQTKS